MNPVNGRETLKCGCIYTSKSASKSCQTESNTQLRTECPHTHTHTLTGGVQKAIGVTQLASGFWDSHVSTNTRLEPKALRLQSGLGETISEWGQRVEGNSAVYQCWVDSTFTVQSTLFVCRHF